MPYSQISDLTALLPSREILQLADDIGGLNDADLLAAAGVGGDGLTGDQAALRKVLMDAISQADREIDGHVGLVRAVPLAAPPGLVSNMSARLAIANLFNRRPHIDPGPWRDVQAGIRRTLDKIGEGKLSLGAEPGKTSQPEAQGVDVIAPARIFGPGEWRRY
ncbi:Protein of unknown function [Desulfonatronum thiosulfatophilum]|uniref:Mu-like prophage protein gp36 n=1 Tax=Desulfonatronum thiosulfatophilum TaxID=617002 RepID=A0A1G6A6S2_9BACT|nr:phage protein Gp36 family protein [Desulfonatronum thiosulfatophilum]SDB03970.1 Protein of unknown function [Desulfonatronum thiosulfatophilum]